MLVLDSLRPLRPFRSLRRLREQPSTRYVCPFCTSLRVTSQSSFPPSRAALSANSQGSITCPSTLRPPKARSFASSTRQRSPGVVQSITVPGPDDIVPSLAGIAPEEHREIRAYLKQWSLDHQKSLQENAPSDVQPGRSTTLPNSLFVRDAVTIEDEDQDPIPVEHHDHDEDAAYDLRTLKPGDAFLLVSARVKTQLAVYLGNTGIQSQYLLADGRWFVDMQLVYKGHVIHDFATEAEMAPVRALMPARPVELVSAESGAVSYQHALGEVPFNLVTSVLRKFATLAQEADECKRLYTSAWEAAYDHAASETRFRLIPIQQLARDYLDLDLDAANHGTKLTIIAKIFDDERFAPHQTRSNYYAHILPKRMYRSHQKVTAWSRAYQDAAARASTGKNVAKELKENPLSAFISKARRLIIKSRQARLPATDAALGPTLSHVRPQSGLPERVPTGEVFSTDDQAIIELLWCTHVKFPRYQKGSHRRNVAVCSLILRAVGAYPDYDLDQKVGTLFLQELGCLDPWFEPFDHMPLVPLPFLGLHEEAVTLKQNEQAALNLLKIDKSTQTPPFADSMAHLRKDWGDLKAFAIDSSSARILDDAISIEPSDDHLDCFWVHCHVAHPSAFLPFEHPFVERARYMGLSAYSSTIGSEPSIPFEIGETLGISPQRPSRVLTCSTLISRNGSVKDVRMVAGVINNVIKIDAGQFRRAMGVETFVPNYLHVGAAPHAPNEIEKTSSFQERKNLIDEHFETFKLLQTLMLARLQARKLENPNYLRIQKMPGQDLQVTVKGSLQADRSYERIFRSEHCYGDPMISVTHGPVVLNETYDDQAVNADPLRNVMTLATESAGLWARQHGVPVIYRVQRCHPEYPPTRLNNLPSHEEFIAPLHGDSILPGPQYSLNLAQSTRFTNPLRSFPDLVNHYQIDAFLRAQAATRTTPEATVLDAQYPLSQQDLLTFINENPGRKELLYYQKGSTRHWVLLALFRAFYFNEAKLPDIWFVMVESSSSIGGKVVSQVRAVLLPFVIKTRLEPSEQGFEKIAKFRQYLPVKLRSVNFRSGEVICTAIGPPFDTPPNLVHPELTLSDGSVSFRNPDGEDTITQRQQ